jgi:CUE domain
MASTIQGTAHSLANVFGRVKANPSSLDWFQLGQLLAQLKRQQRKSNATSALERCWHQLVVAAPLAYRLRMWGRLLAGIIAVLGADDDEEPFRAMESMTALIRASTCAREDSIISLQWNSKSDARSDMEDDTRDDHVLSLQLLKALASFYSIWKARREPQEQSLQNMEEAGDEDIDEHSSTPYQEHKLLEFLSHVTWGGNGTLFSCEQVVSHVQTLQSIDDGPHDASIWMALMQYETETNAEWRDQLLEKYSEEENDIENEAAAPSNDRKGSNTNLIYRDYLETLLVPAESETPPATSPLLSEARPAAEALVATKSIDVLQERIDQIRQVLPHLGEGFVEAALAYKKLNVEATVSALLEDPHKWPTAWRLLDTTLPRRKKDTTVASNVLNDDEDLKEITKATIRAQERHQQEEAFAIDAVMQSQARNEYNDDYDDQYDFLAEDNETAAVAVPPSGSMMSEAENDREPVPEAHSRKQQRRRGRGVASGRGGPNQSNNGNVSRNDTEYQHILQYNRAMKQVEEENSYWDAQRNTNRSGVQHSGGRGPRDGNEQSTENARYRGPDKLKGGRIPRVDGRGGRGTQQVGGDGGPGVVHQGGGSEPGGVGGLSEAREGSQDGSSASGHPGGRGNPAPGRSGQRGKERALMKRREKQKQAASKRS